MDKTYIANWHHALIAEKLQDAFERVKKNEKVRIMITLPPRHGKSRLATQLFPAWVLGKDPTMPFIVTSYAADLAEKFGQATRDIMKGKAYKTLFSKSRIRKDSRAKGNWSLTEGGSYTAVGAGGPITGKGAKIAIIDDVLKNREEAESKTMREKIYDWYTSTLYTRLEGYGAVIVIMTRWHSDDLAGKLLYEDEQRQAAGEDYEGWEVLNFPALAENEEKWNTELMRIEGDALWPQKYPKDNLMKIKATVGVYDWNALYQQNPVAAENQIFKQETFQKYNEDDIKDKSLAYYTMVDPAISQKDEADNTVVLTVGKDLNGPNWYRIREDAGHYTPGQTVELIFKHQQMYDSEVYLETVAYQKALKYSIEEEQRARQRYFMVHELKATTAKEYRIKGLVPLYERGVIFHKHDDKEYENELLTFPRGRRDDRIDCMAHGIAAIDNTIYNGGKAKTNVPRWFGYGRRQR